MEVAFGKVRNSLANKSHRWEKSGRESKYVCNCQLLCIMVAMTSESRGQGEARVKVSHAVGKCLMLLLGRCYLGQAETSKNH